MALTAGNVKATALSTTCLAWSNPFRQAVKKRGSPKGRVAREPRAVCCGVTIYNSRGVSEVVSHGFTVTTLPTDHSAGLFPDHSMVSLGCSLDHVFPDHSVLSPQSFLCRASTVEPATGFGLQPLVLPNKTAASQVRPHQAGSNLSLQSLFHTLRLHGGAPKPVMEPNNTSNACS